MAVIGKPFEKGNSGKPKGAVSKTTKQSREAFAAFAEGQEDRVLKTIEGLDGKDYLDYMERIVYTRIFPKITQNELTVHQSENLDTTELREISIEARQRIRDILISEQSKSRISDAVIVEETITPAKPIASSRNIPF
jgi:hypothetical protein